MNLRSKVAFLAFSSMAWRPCMHIFILRLDCLDSFLLLYVLR